jgi:hypothetical protein
MELDLWNSLPEPVPTVDPADLRKVWVIMIESPDTRATCINVFESACSQGANVLAVWYRAAILELCERLGLLSRWLRDGHLDDAVINVAANFPVEKLEIGVVRKDLPLDVREFVARVEMESGTSKE